ncbi:sulfotransferase family 2 domain-containing protein [Tabrizicola soli]|uniref:Sulfotransferase family 2 domain-containing protein n=1 Tax=Tabrizicola soli TaxID=2185115 RepID=A0ABV7DZS9_9RHOB
MPVYRIGTTKVLFIHIPKTAGMAIGEHLGKAGPAVFEERIPVRGGVFGPRHQPAAVLNRVFLPEMIDYAFMVVRHPVARLVSEYRYQRRSGLVQFSRLRMFGFNAWLRYALHRLRSDPDWRVGHFRPQVDYECFRCEVFRYEDGLERVMRRLAEVTDTDLPQVTAPRNVSIQRPVSVSRHSLSLIAEAYASDFRRFDYPVAVPVMTGVTSAD